MEKLLKDLNEKMQKSIHALEEDLGGMKAGRANPKMLDKIEVEYYGTPTMVNQLAGISIPEPRIILIQPYDKSAMKDIEKAILKSDLGINPSNDGIAIRLVVPELTGETRKELVKNIKKSGEDLKIVLRSQRREANDKIKTAKKDGEISEDEVKSLEEKVQKETDKYVIIVDKLIVVKEKEIMTV